MTNNPFINALAAGLYIAGVVLVLNTIITLTEGSGDNSILIPLVMLSLFVLSAATMGYIFFYQPLQMLLEGKRKEAVDLFLKTTAIFAGITFVFVLSLIFFSQKAVFQIGGM